MDRGYVLGVTNDRDVVVGAVVLKIFCLPAGQHELFELYTTRLGAC
jgi:hypothetical protein